MKIYLVVLLSAVLLSIHIATTHSDVVLEIEQLSISCDDLTRTSLYMDNFEDTVAALQIDILYDSNCFIITGVEKTERSEMMDIFNYSDIDGGIRLAMTGISHAIEPGFGSIATIHFIYHACFWGILKFSGCKVAGPHGNEIACTIVKHFLFIFDHACDLIFSWIEFDFGTVLVEDTVFTILDLNNIGNSEGTVSITVGGCAICEEDDVFLEKFKQKTITIGCSPINRGPVEGTITFSGCTCDDEIVTISCYGIECEGRGDANDDEYINVLDVVYVVNLILSTRMPDPDSPPFCRADCTADGVINILDVISIVEVILGTGSCEP